MFDAAPEDPNYNPLPEERPGGFDWGQGERVGAREEEDANRQQGQWWPDGTCAHATVRHRYHGNTPVV